MNTTIKKSFSISAILKLAWGLFKKHWQFLILAALAVIAIEIIFIILIGFTSGVVSTLLLLISYIIQIIYTVGFINIFITIARGNKPSWSSFIEKISLFGKYILGVILYGLIVLLGFVLLIFPGIYFAIKYGFWFYVLIENPDMGVIKTFKKSAMITKNIKLKIFLAGFVFSLVSSAGLILLGVGLLVTAPLAAISTALMYVTLRNQTEGAEDPIGEKSKEKKGSKAALVLLIIAGVLPIVIIVVIMAIVSSGALEGARDRALDASAMATLSQVRAQAELDGDYATVCAGSASADLIEFAQGQVGQTATCLDEGNTPDSEGYAVHIDLHSGGTFCVDSQINAISDVTAQTIDGMNVCN